MDALSTWLNSRDLGKYYEAFAEAEIVLDDLSELNDDDLREIFWEGVCVTAAHQFLTVHGQVGFVDDAGAPNADYKSANERIAAFAALGAAVIGTYFRIQAKA